MYLKHDEQSPLVVSEPKKVWQLVHFVGSWDWNDLESMFMLVKVLIYFYNRKLSLFLYLYSFDNVR